MTIEKIKRVIRGLTETLDIYIQEINEGREKEDVEKLKGFMREIDRQKDLLKKEESKCKANMS